MNLTLTGERVGTPLYMAPEQHAGDGITVLADQFAFANALWLAAYGALPFRGDTSAAVVASMKEPLPATANRNVPDHVRAALARALSFRPADRWPKLTDLLAELARDPAAKRRRRLATLAIGAAVAAVAGPLAFVAGRHAPTAADPCDGGERLAASVWADSARARAESAFLGTGLPTARASFDRVDAAMRDHLASWSAAHRNTCEATRVRHEQSEGLLDLRMACLENARGELAAFTEALGRDLDRDRIDRAVAASVRPLDLAPCSNAAELQAAVAPPRDPEAARLVADLGVELDRLDTEGKLGRAVVVLPQARALLPRVRAAGSPPLLARLLNRLGTLETLAGDSDAGVDHLYEAARAAGEAHDDYLHARILATLITKVGVSRGRVDEASRLIPLAEGAALRVGHEPELLTSLYHAEGAFYYQARHDAPAALGRLGLALALAQSPHDPEGVEIGLILNSIGSAEYLIGGAERALPPYRRAEKILAARLGPDHPSTMLVTGNIGSTLLFLGDYQEAEGLIQRDLEQSERNWGAESEDVAIAAGNLAYARLYLGRIAEAHELADRSLAICARVLGDQNPVILDQIDVSARVALEEDRLDAAIAGQRRAIAIGEAALGKDNEALITPLLGLSEVELAAGHLGEARTAATRALAVVNEVAGSRLAEALLREGDVLARSRRFAEAIADYEKALARTEEEHGPAHPLVLEILRSSVDPLLASGRVVDAVAAAERAHGLAASRGPWFLARTELALARALAADGKDRTRALALAQSARARLDGTGYRRVLREIDAFLAAAPR